MDRAASPDRAAPGHHGMAARRAIESAVARIFPGGRVIEVRELAGGVSARVCSVEVLSSDNEKQRLVFRQHQSADFKAHSRGVTATEFKLLNALHQRGMEVPAALYLDDSETLTAPFFIMESIEGSTQVPPAEVASAIAQMADFLARLHAVDPSELDVPELELLEDPLASLPQCLPDDDVGIALRTAILDGDFELVRNPAVLIHGDYWPGNVIWRYGQLAAVIDWEDSRVGDPLADLASARVELLCQFGEQAMDGFTEHYLQYSAARAGSLRGDSLPLWEVFVAASALAAMADWGLDPAEEQERRRRTEGFFRRAGAQLLRQRRT